MLRLVNKHDQLLAVQFYIILKINCGEAGSCHVDTHHVVFKVLYSQVFLERGEELQLCYCVVGDLSRFVNKFGLVAVWIQNSHKIS